MTGFALFIAALVLMGGLAFSVAAMERDPATGRRKWKSRKNQAVILVTILLGLFYAEMLRRNLNIKVQRSRGTEAIIETRNMERAITKLLSDAGRASLRDLFVPAPFEKACLDYAELHTVDAFEAAMALYTSGTCALLHDGREVLTLSDDELDPTLRDVFNEEVVKNLGTSYMLELGTDPWGNDYRIFAGPWPEDWEPVLFRSSRKTPTNPDDSGDALTIQPTKSDSELQGYPAPAAMDVYVWSLGANGVSDQPRYDPTRAYAAPARSHYREDATDEYLGGGDDINNWDRDMSYMLFYN